MDASGLLWILLALVAGAASWTLAEYALHTWIFHGLRGWGPSRLHLEHHARPHWFAPASAKAASAIVFVAIVFPVAILVTNLVIALAYTSAFVVTYLVYELLHRRAHTHPPRTAYGMWLRKNHLYHHFGHPKMAQGVTTPVWDHVFGTQVAPEVVRVPRRFARSASPWLLGPDGEIRPELADDFELVGRDPGPVQDRADTDQDQRDHDAAFANVAPTG